MRWFRSLFYGLSTAIAASPALMPRAPTGSFNLYAYGTGIGGAPVFYAGDVVYLGQLSSLNSTEAAPVLFETGDNNALKGNPNTTSSTTSPSWSNVTLFVPGPTSSSHKVGFSNTTTNGTVSASGFVFYGQDVLHENSNGNLETLWYAVPASMDSVWSLNWNSTGDETEGIIMVSLRSAAPSRPDFDEDADA
ncbi:hypothetical protein F5X99DRAFT_401617 [Biscogniauxia marginata]|nr:hypothetical protein F5X99DRAFT_401617 [Biscogniauxia marginata]